MGRKRNECARMMGIGHDTTLACEGNELSGAAKRYEATATGRKRDYRKKSGKNYSEGYRETEDWNTVRTRVQGCKAVRG